MGDLSEKQLKAIDLITSGCRLVDIAKALKITDRTLRNWRNIPEFAIRLRQIESNNFDSAVNKLRDASSLAADNLIELCASASVAPQVRVRACEIVLSYAKPAPGDDDILAAISAFCKAGIMPTDSADKLMQNFAQFKQTLIDTLADGGLKP